MSIVEKVEEHREDWQRHEAALHVDAQTHEISLEEFRLNSEYQIAMETVKALHDAVGDLLGMDNEYGLERLERR